MIEVSYKHMSQYPVTSALQVLVNKPLPSQLAYEVGKLAYHVDRGERDMRKAYANLVKEYVTDWEPGKKLDVPADKKENFSKAEEKFFEEGKFEVDRRKLKFVEVLGPHQLTPSQVLALEPFFDELPDA